ncbi:MAG: tRNA (N(6)-L-threonylcarbamoyladenosine(37)-C(2))-methylthiotransferase MtaB [Thermodesulfobacteriota bacterium]|nr:tRNA (N(6)-L-threonylcarbamoyladenosine(37)-C(2))-methylthiotransferase MtaB [Thermodesulfobacteriota bacterium]
MKKLKFAITTLGCKVNQYESEAIRSSLEEEHYTLTAFGNKADIYIINTCTVTHKACYKSFQMIRRALKKNSRASVIVTGCHAQKFYDEIKELPGVTHIIGNREKFSIPEILKKKKEEGNVSIMVNKFGGKDSLDDPPVYDFKSRKRAILKIQDGCNRACSYCIIPQTRGRSRSLDPDEAIKRTVNLFNGNYNEVVITGIHLGDYGKELKPKEDLLNLLYRMEDNKEIKRVRLSSLEPQEISQEFIVFLGNSRILCNHLHISLQSGSDNILARMNRPYRVDLFRDIVLSLKERVADINLGCDVITGFPHETGEEFKKTLNLLKELPLDYFHVFPFSSRPGTPAHSMENRVEKRIISNRAKILRELAAKKRRNFYESQTGKILPMIPEKSLYSNKNIIKGTTKNYIPIFVKNSPSIFFSEEILVKVTEVNENGVYGEAIQ